MKKKLFYILLVLITIFSFNISAKADALDCEYRLNNKTIVLATRSKKKFKYYYYQASKEDSNLSLPVGSKDWKSAGGILDSWKVGNPISNEADKCPAHVDAIKVGSEYALRFYDKNSDVKCGKDSKDDICNGYLIEIPKEKVDTTSGDDIKKQLETTSCDKLDFKNYWLNEDNANSHSYSCLYGYSATNSCTLAQIDYNYDGSLVGSPQTFEIGLNTYDIGFDNISVAGIRSKNKNLSCPEKIYFKTMVCESGISFCSGAFDLNSGGDFEFKLLRSSYKDSSGNETEIPEEGNGGNASLLINNGSSKITCDDIVGSGEGSLQEILKNAILIARILIPIIVIALSISDIATAIFGEEDKMKKAQSKFIKRLIIAVVFFLAPSLLKMILTLANSIWPSISNDFCGIL